MIHKFLHLIGGLFFTLALLKLPLLFTPSPQADYLDPIIHVLTRQQMVVTAFSCELLVGLYCLVGSSTLRRLLTVYTCGTMFAAYRIASAVAGKVGDCGCLGVAPQLFGLSDGITNALSISILVLGVGGAAYGLWPHRTRLAT